MTHFFFVCSTINGQLSEYMCVLSALIVFLSFFHGLSFGHNDRAWPCSSVLLKSMQKHCHFSQANKNFMSWTHQVISGRLSESSTMMNVVGPDILPAQMECVAEIYDNLRQQKVSKMSFMNSAFHSLRGAAIK